jgi:hypothetical protein
VCGHQRQIDVATFFNRLTAIHRFDHCELARFFLDQPCDPIEIFSTLSAGQFAPRVLISTARRLYCSLDIARVALGDFGQFLLSGGVY